MALHILYNTLMVEEGVEILYCVIIGKGVLELELYITHFASDSVSISQQFMGMRNE